MTTKKKVLELVETVFADKSQKYRDEILGLLSPEYEIGMLKDLIIRMEKTQEIAYPLALYGKKTKHERKQGGANSHGMSAKDRRDRNESMQKEIDRLCLQKKHSFSSARCIVAKKHSLHPGTLKRIVKNPSLL